MKTKAVLSLLVSLIFFLGLMYLALYVIISTGLKLSHILTGKDIVIIFILSVAILIFLKIVYSSISYFVEHGYDELFGKKEK